jgi:hypothetical protein
MFDTGQAARVLNYPSASLAHLLEKHTGTRHCSAHHGPHHVMAALWQFILLADSLLDPLSLTDLIPPPWCYITPLLTVCQELYVSAELS